jgi:hypothetical protein
VRRQPHFHKSAQRFYCGAFFLPKLLTHWIFAEDLRQRLPSNGAVARAVNRHPNLYRYGAVAPDTPFYLLWGPGSRTLNAHAEAFHETGAGLERFLRNTGSERRLALAAGVFSHAAADAVFHPMVYYFSSAGTGRARSRHHRLEAWIDLYFSRNFQRSEVSRLDSILEGLEVDIGTLIDWLAVLFDLDPRRHRRHLQRALRRNVYFLRLFSNRAARLLAGWAFPISPDGLRAYLAHFYPLQPPPPERLFTAPIAYRNPATGEPHRRRIDEMKQEAIDDALALCQKMQAGEHRLSVLMPRGWNLHTGIGAQPKAAMTFFDTDVPVRQLVGF